MKIIEIDHNSELYDSALNIWNKVWPDYAETIKEWKHFDRNFEGKYFFKRFIIKSNSNYVATGFICEPWWSFKEGKLHFDIAVLKEYRRKGIGSNFFEFIETIFKDKGGYKLNITTKEDYTDGRVFLKNRDFEIVLREPASKLKIDEFDYSKFVDLEERVKSSGIEIHPLSTLENIDKDWQKNLFQLYNAVIVDVPSNDLLTERTFEQFKKIRFEAPGFNPDSFFVALDNKKYVGLSSLWIQLNKPKEYWTDLTGVIRSHRRKGIASALKIQTIRYVKENGGISIETDNEENNPMFGLNKSLGFVPMPAWLTYEKHNN